MGLLLQIMSDDLRRDALYASQRRGRQVSRFRIFYRTLTWLTWSWLLPIIGIGSVLFHLVWVPYFDPISSAISLAESQAQLPPVIVDTTPSILSSASVPLPQPLPSTEAVQIPPLILDYCISKPNIQNLDFCISKPLTQEKP